MAPQPTLAPPYQLHALRPADCRDHLPALKNLFDEYGVIYLPGLLHGDVLFEAFVSDLKRLTGMLLEQAGAALDAPAPLDEMVNTLARVDRRSAGRLYDLGSRPNKLVSGNRLKMHPDLLALIQGLFGEEALLATPSQSDLLHVFPPGAENYRYNLPLHQDFQYIMQSPAQLTMFVPLSAPVPETGGIVIYPGTHRRGIAPCFRNEFGHYELAVPDAELAAYPEHAMTLGLGDVAIFHSLLYHRSVRNTSPDRTRLVQLFRYSDLNVSEARAFHWASTVHAETNGITFGAVYPEKIRTAPEAAD